MRENPIPPNKDQQDEKFFPSLVINILDLLKINEHCYAQSIV